ncbi:MAG: hypothetical protein QOG59_1627, partial [Solirubrobacteraceae bacterium]|nr:hypothetical protein [Solirubrobacteraceae bacterium]
AASVIRLQAPSAGATSGVTLGGASFAPSTGRLGTIHATHLRSSRAGTVRVSVGAASAALVTLEPRAAGSAQPQ